MADARPFDPAALLAVLGRHEVAYVLIGGLAGTLYGSPHVTTDVDITPSPAPDNLHRLSAALEELDARVRAPGAPDGLPFSHSPESLEGLEVLNLTTRHGDLDIQFAPAGTGGYADLKRQAVELSIQGTPVTVAALADVVRSKAAADREKDRLTLPTLRRLLDRLDRESRR